MNDRCTNVDNRCLEQRVRACRCGKCRMSMFDQWVQFIQEDPPWLKQCKCKNDECSSCAPQSCEPCEPPKGCCPTGDCRPCSPLRGCCPTGDCRPCTPCSPCPPCIPCQSCCNCS